MKKLLRSSILQRLPWLLLRLSSVWLLAAFAVVYYGDNDCHQHEFTLRWPLVFFAGSIVFSIALYFWDRLSSPPKAD